MQEITLITLSLIY